MSAAKKPRLRFNSEYFKLWKEVIFLLLLNVTKKPQSDGNGRILIVNPCLIGEFGASVPAIRDFIARHPKTPVDLVVTGAARPLAERIIGVERVYVTLSVYGRERAIAQENMTPPDGYEKIIALRMSPEAFALVKNVRAKALCTSFRFFLRYGLHLSFCLIRGKTPKQWRAVNFEMLGGVAGCAPPPDMHFGEMFAPTVQDYRVRGRIASFAQGEKTVIVHTGTPWVMKRFPNERWIDALRKIADSGPYRFIFIGTEGDRVDYTHIAERIDAPTLSLIGDINLAELMVVLDEGDYFIGIDSGPATLAHLVDIPSLIIFGPGPHMYLPYNPRDVFLDRSRGRGLSQMFFSSRRNSLIEKISADDVVGAFVDLVAKVGDDRAGPRRTLGPRARARAAR
ncbi:glycosyltransferase family 9 protein [Varunaivibrio sulfuroxidans]|uniref:ADP-heptose:LPS heptosyltransferase n=1 Tax=Varunaivibrio sulfuroxidans TaxID=1773489 RepID=A0A4V2UN99_9PROT|nr:glycosyltransferase family 9 protein [Varunaivibrio sulfuroxidans]TCS61291.1 ADP-heptose:LPS heptosyltransferase [Varunaivibrio sulfuroxidans]WES31093.1 glycosyltransferase family 9 protein [Varunaivibrio sulfuroxidans]